MQVNLFCAGKKENNNLRESMAKGYPHGGMFLPLLWSLGVDDLFWELNNDGHYTVGYAKDTAILIIGKFLQMVPEVVQTSLCTVQQWCNRTNLHFNRNKTVVIPFTRKRKLKGLKEPTPFNKTIQLTSEVK
jgi:hypothetical protein